MKNAARGVLLLGRVLFPLEEKCWDDGQGGARNGRGKKKRADAILGGIAGCVVEREKKGARK